MIYLGRQQLGTYIDVYWQILVSGVPTLPDMVPRIKITQSSDGAVKYTGLMPIVDKEITPGLFCTRLLLGTGFVNGTHAIEMFALVGGNPVLAYRTFEIIPGGSPLGQVIGMNFLHTPSADWIVYQIESGRLMAGKQPSLK